MWIPLPLLWICIVSISIGFVVDALPDDSWERPPLEIMELKLLQLFVPDTTDIFECVGAAKIVSSLFILSTGEFNV